MAKADTNASMVMNLTVLMVSFLLLVSLAESQFFGNGILTPPSPMAPPPSSPSPPTLECDSVYGVISGDTCFEVAKTFKLTLALFETLNPNLNCSALFIGQWLCLDGKLT
ncbi:putative LysM domain-containing protein [Rosa chinensis]|uniref:Putative LysM domain-containing protein n=1 Tax=Rosa chinensis TaxID=74649 RepID=A0A2P6Q3H5_ROSCH|nr:putative LysM domain-containing protein [Rosa chinensis]